MKKKRPRINRTKLNVLETKEKPDSPTTFSTKRAGWMLIDESPLKKP